MNKWPQNIRITLPSCCLVCGASAREIPNLCDDCVADLPFLASACPICAIPLPAPAICPGCQKSPWRFDRSHAVFHYRAPVNRLVQLMKFDGRLAACHTLGWLMARNLVERLDRRPHVIVPVPLHPSRLRQRGYNQALEVARPLARLLGTPLDSRRVFRERSTAPQTDLKSPAERRRNVHRAFGCRPVAPGITYAAVVDDVVTTCSTVDEVAASLRDAGVRRVDIWTCARASFPGT